MNLSIDFVDRFERVKEDFKKSMYRDLCHQVDAWFSPLIAELKAQVNMVAIVATTATTTTTTATRSDARQLASRQTSSHQAQQQQSYGDFVMNNRPNIPQYLNYNLGDQPGQNAVLRADPFWSSGATCTSRDDDAVGTENTHIQADDREQHQQHQPSLIKEEVTSDHSEEMIINANVSAGGHHDDYWPDDDSDCDCADCAEDEEEVKNEDEDLDTEQIPAKIPRIDDHQTNSSTFHVLQGATGSSATTTTTFDLVGRDHLNHKQYYCRYSGCDRSFTKRCQLTAHNQTHRNTRYHCKWPGCSLDFATRSNILQHIKLNHPFEGSIVDQPGCDQNLFIEETPFTESIMDIVTLPFAIKCFRCKWPGCDYQSDHSGNTTRHIRTQHFNLPRTVREQKEQGIEDSRDPNEFVEVFTKTDQTSLM